ncbi:MAG: HAD family phosphatase [Shinella sp.]|nr:HAD family phosphatase [Shinella sp.]
MIAKAVLFDMDGTLVDSEALHYETLAAAVEDFGYGVPDGFADRITGMTIADCHAALVQEAGFRPTLAQLVDAKYRRYAERASKLLLRNGTREALAALAGTGAKMAIVSNSDRIIVDVNLRAVGLQAPGLVSVSRNDVRSGKPHPEPYLRAAWLLDVEPSDCVVVEDSAPGARAGLAAGMAVIGWPEPHRIDIEFPAGVIPADPLDLAAALGRFLPDSIQTASISRTA